MPTLDWIGKKAVLNHHRQVPYHLLKSDSTLSVGGVSPMLVKTPTTQHLALTSSNLPNILGKNLPTMGKRPF